MNTLSLEDELFFMSNLYPKHTGLPFVIWISTGIGVQHDIRVKVSRGPKARPAEMISVGLRPNVHVIDGELSSAEVALLTRWVDLNLAVLLDYWNAELDTADALARLKILGA